MQYYNFQFLTVDPGYSFDDLSYDVADIFMDFSENPYIGSIDIVSEGGQKVSLLIATDILTIPEIEELLIAKFSENFRDPQNYILLAPESAEV